MKRFLLLLAAAWLALGVGKNPRLAYIDRYSSLAVLEMQRTGVPASITLAQAILESGSGQSPLATVANNHFGLKCHNDWQGEKFFYDDETPDECFRVYTTVEDSYRAHSDFLRGRERYQSLFELDPTDYKGWAKGLRLAGYATDPGYATKLINLIEDFQLYRFDTMTEDDLPAGQEEEAAPETVPADAFLICERESPGMVLSDAFVESTGADPADAFLIHGRTLGGRTLYRICLISGGPWAGGYFTGPWARGYFTVSVFPDLCYNCPCARRMAAVICFQIIRFLSRRLEDRSTAGQREEGVKEAVKEKHANGG